MFPILNEYLISVNINDKELMNILCQHLKELASNFDHYFPEHEDPRNGTRIFSNPFNEDVYTCNLNPLKKKV